MGFTKHEPRSGLREYEERWERAGRRDAEGQNSPGVVSNLNGDWRVERLSGPVPMPFVWKRIRAGRGTTRVSPPLRRGLPVEPKLPFRLEQRDGHVALIYLGPLSFLVDELRLEEDGSWLGRANAAGVRYAWFRMVPVENPRSPLAGSEAPGAANLSTVHGRETPAPRGRFRRDRGAGPDRIGGEIGSRPTGSP